MKSADLTTEEKNWLLKATRTDINGWIHIKTQGAPFERGFQHGYLTAAEHAEAIRVYKPMTYESTGMDYSFFVEAAVKYHEPIIKEVAPDLLEEMQGIAAGYTKAGLPTTVGDIIGWNAYEEMTGYWWPAAAHTYASSASVPTSMAKSHCSAFIATGSATTDGRIVLGHQTFTDFWNGQFMNLILDIQPDNGHRMVMQASPGWIASMTDFWVTGAGLVVSETTIVGFSGYDIKKVPEYVRVRKACQGATNIDEWTKLLDAGNNGGYANMWLVGDVNTNEIAKFEQGLKYNSFQKTTDGWYFGDNVPDDPRIRNLECSDTGFNDIRQQTGARRTRWPQLLGHYNGMIDAFVGQTILADTFDVYLMRINPSSRTICSHYDVDPMSYASDPNAVWNIPYFPGGSIDGKVTTAEMARKMSLSARFGRADGTPFDADEFLRIHPQWNWQKGYLKSRQHQPWTLFNG
ncbi:MAG: peptidase C45 [Verrucomicrobia bacterium]|nr:peptidase C45 [Verrucomicrobiota bacterium]